MLIATDDPETTTTADPELLIEEARQRQRRRLRRIASALTAVAVVAALGVGIDRLVYGGSVEAKQSAPTAVGATRGRPSPTRSS